jgi:hypothetical protein
VQSQNSRRLDDHEHEVVRLVLRVLLVFVDENSVGDADKHQSHEDLRHEAGPEE